MIENRGSHSFATLPGVLCKTTSSVDSVNPQTHQLLDGQILHPART